MPLSSFDQCMWAAGFLGHVLLLSVIFYKKRQVEFPVFTALIAFNVLRSCLLHIVLSRHSEMYFTMYWSLAAVDGFLGFAILYESASIVFRPTGVWAQDIKGALWVILLLSVGVGVLLTWVVAPATRFGFQVPILRGKFLAATLMTELFVGIMALSARAGLAWRTHVARICQGLGFYSAFCVVTDTVLAYHGTQRDSALYQEFSHLRILFYLACLVFWIVALWLQAPEPRKMPEAVHQQLVVLQARLNADLGRLRAWR
jgi:hypothetical protein